MPQGNRFTYGRALAKSGSAMPQFLPYKKEVIDYGNKIVKAACSLSCNF